MTATVKTCPKCGEDKPLSGFYPNRARRNGRSTYCKPCQREARRQWRRGHPELPTYRSWLAMNERCANQNKASYKNYGGRGIAVCERWSGKGGFESFLADMGPRPEGTTLDRIDPDGDYTPANCRWATRREQRANRRDKTLQVPEGDQEAPAEAGGSETTKREIALTH